LHEINIAIGAKMSFDKRKIDEIGAYVEMAKHPTPLFQTTNESLKLVKDLTIGDLIITFGCNVDEATMVLKNTLLASKKNMAPGLRSTTIKESKIVKTIKKVIKECGCEEPTNDYMEFDLTGDVDYHPHENPMGGSRFEDHGNSEQAGMIKSNLYSIFTKAQSLHDMVGDNDELPEWVQEKIAVIDEYIDTISDYLSYEYHETRDMYEARKK